MGYVQCQRVLSTQMKSHTVGYLHHAAERFYFLPPLNWPVAYHLECGRRSKDYLSPCSELDYKSTAVPPPQENAQEACSGPRICAT